MYYTIKWPVTKRNTARSANLHVYTGIHTTTQRGTVYTKLVHRRNAQRGCWWRRSTAGVKHKEWSVVDLVLSELTVTEMGICMALESKTAYRIAGYIGGNNIWRIAGKGKKIAIGRYKFGGFGTIGMP